MTKPILLIALFFYLTCLLACESRKPISEEKEENRKVIYGQPVSVRNTDYTIIPMRIVDERDIADARYKDDGTTAENISQQANNLIFFDEKTEETHLLTTRKFERIAFYFEDIGSKKQPSTIIIYRTLQEDSNKDGFLDWKDAVVVYISDNRGRHFRPVTPQNTRTIDWTVEREKGQVYFRYIEDTDQNGVFDLRDPIRINRMNINQLRDPKRLSDSTQISTPLINDEDRKRYEEVLLEQ